VVGVLMVRHGRRVNAYEWGIADALVSVVEAIAHGWPVRK